MIINFKIAHIDPLGQGVFKENDQIYFIPKTLEGEEGAAEVLSSKKGVNFARIVDPTSFVTYSEQRQQSTCPHFNKCPSCHFLHTSYENEIQIKKNNISRILTKMTDLEIDICKAKNRLGYRNRIQLHYNLKQKKLGYVDPLKSQIVEIPNCQIGSPALQSKLKELYEDNSWIKYIKSHTKNKKGHIEIYGISPEKCNININMSYAFSGFTQVNQEMNLELCQMVKNEVESVSDNNINFPILDLFGGDGNLSNNLISKNTIILDKNDSKKMQNGQDFKKVDLFLNDSLENFSKDFSKESFKLFIVDPPRNGFKFLSQWTNHFKPKYVLYVSCNYQTMIRDIKSISHLYSIKKIKAIDLFPGTYHLEALTLLKLN